MKTAYYEVLVRDRKRGWEGWGTYESLREAKSEVARLNKEPPKYKTKILRFAWEEVKP